jgi:hypothetical protein
MTDVLVSLLALLGVPAALVTLIVLAALTVTRRRTSRQAPAWTGQPEDQAARQAWAAAYTANVRIARLEARVRDLERAATTESSRWGGRP